MTLIKSDYLLKGIDYLIEAAKREEEKAEKRLDESPDDIYLSMYAACTAIVADRMAIRELVTSAPTITADELPFVRCKNCKYFSGDGEYCAQEIFAPFGHFYCYYGEKKENNATN